MSMISSIIFLTLGCWTPQQSSIPIKRVQQNIPVCGIDRHSDWLLAEMRRRILSDLALISDPLIAFNTLDSWIARLRAYFDMTFRVSLLRRDLRPDYSHPLCYELLMNTDERRFYDRHPSWFLFESARTPPFDLSRTENHIFVDIRFMIEHEQERTLHADEIRDMSPSGTPPSMSSTSHPGTPPEERGKAHSAVWVD